MRHCLHLLETYSFFSSYTCRGGNIRRGRQVWEGRHRWHDDKRRL